MNPPLHLLVDGSNLLHAWTELRKLLPARREAARELLSGRLRVLHDSEQIRVTIVFDGRGSDLIQELPSKLPTFVHLFTPSGMTADDAIEQIVGKAQDPTFYRVATDDSAERATIQALGALAVSSAELAAWIARAEARQSSQLSGLRAKVNKEWRRPHAP